LTLPPDSIEEKNRPDWLAPSVLPRSLHPLFEMRPRTAFALAALLVLAIAYVDLIVEENVSIGIVFLIPIMLASIHLNRWQVVLVALLCAIVRETVAPFAWQLHFETRMASVIVTFLAGGLFASEVGRNRRIVLRSLTEIEEQIHRRYEAEAQLRSLVESSPAAIINVNSDGVVDLANQAAHSLLGVEPGKLPGRPIAHFLPLLSDMLARAADAVPLRTATSCRGLRASGESFLAYAWFATYPTRTGHRLSAIVTDSSDELRDWQQTSLETLLRSTRVLVGSVSHEIRNMCAAINVANTNLGRLPTVAGTEDYQAMQMLVQGLSRLAAYELQTSSEAEVGTLSVTQLLEEFRIIVDPTIEAAGVPLDIQAPALLPLADGDRHGLLQVLLNLTRNSLRVLQGHPDPALHLQVAQDGEWVYLRFIDNGPGVPDSSRLFQPFQSGADAVGLGLFVSRSIVRGCGGELYHEPTGSGCAMCIRLRCSDPDPSAGDLDHTELHA
jgi:signal transduction histidine kinase